MYLRANADSTLNIMPVGHGDNMEKQHLTPTQRYNLEIPINLMWMSLDCGKAAVMLKRTNAQVQGEDANSKLKTPGWNKTCKLALEQQY